jgi:hypothetical protein
MSVIFKDGLRHIEGSNWLIKEAALVKNSPYSKSETRFVKAIEFKPSLLGLPTGDNIILVDTPGSEDNKSPEIDLSNNLGIVKAIH